MKSIVVTGQCLSSFQYTFSWITLLIFLSTHLFAAIKFSTNHSMTDSWIFSGILCTQINMTEDNVLEISKYFTTTQYILWLLFIYKINLISIEISSYWHSFCHFSAVQWSLEQQHNNNNHHWEQSIWIAYIYIPSIHARMMTIKWKHFG